MSLDCLPLWNVPKQPAHTDNLINSLGDSMKKLFLSLLEFKETISIKIYLSSLIFIFCFFSINSLSHASGAVHETLQALDAAADDHFAEVAMSDNILVVGAVDDDDLGSNSGAAYVYELDSNNDWRLDTKLLASDGSAGDGLGVSISVDEDFAIIGSLGANGGAGAAYVFERDISGSWSEVAKLVANDAASGDFFGNTVAISGDYAIVGARFNTDNGARTGSAYVYERTSAGWMQIQKILPVSSNADDEFGASVAIDGSIAFIGSPGAENSLNENTGSVLVFELNGSGAWIETAELEANGVDAFARFGGAVAVEGSRAVIGAPNHNNLRGRAYIFDFDAATSSWVVSQPLASLSNYRAFGSTVAVSGDVVYVGAPFSNNNGGNAGAGLANRYEYIDSNFGWSGAQDIGQGTFGGNWYGWSVAVSGDHGAVGAYNGIANGINASGLVHTKSLVGIAPEPRANVGVPDGQEFFTWVATEGLLDPPNGGASTAVAQLKIGTTSGSSDVHNSGQVPFSDGLTFAQNMPSVPLFATLEYGISAFDCCDVHEELYNTLPLTPLVLFPDNESKLSTTDQFFTWTSNDELVDEWWLYVGSGIGLANYHDSGNLQSVTSSTALGLPGDESTIYLRLWYRQTGGNWSFVDTNYVAASAGSPDINSPSPGFLLNSPTENFSWSANGSVVDEWWIYAGSFLGGNDHHDSGNLSGATSTTVNGLPSDSSTVYVRLWYRQAGSSWSFTDSTYTAATAGIPEVNSPVNGEVVRSPTEIFSWSANGAAVDEWWIFAGSTVGAFDFHNSGNLLGGLTTRVNGLPSDSSTIYIRLWYRRTGGSWSFVDSSYTAASTVSIPVFINPASIGDPLENPFQFFFWSANGAIVDEWWIYAGTSPGSNFYDDSGNLFGQTSTTLSIDTGSPFFTDTHIRLWYRQTGGDWSFIDNIYQSYPTP